MLQFPLHLMIYPPALINFFYPSTLLQSKLLKHSIPSFYTYSKLACGTNSMSELLYLSKLITVRHISIYQKSLVLYQITLLYLILVLSTLILLFLSNHISTICLIQIQILTTSLHNLNNLIYVTYTLLSLLIMSEALM